MAQGIVLGFGSKGVSQAPKKFRPARGARPDEPPSDEDRRQHVAREIGKIFDELDDQCIKKRGGRVVSKEDFQLLQWAKKQMEIRRLQDECERMLTEIDFSASNLRRAASLMSEYEAIMDSGGTDQKH